MIRYQLAEAGNVQLTLYNVQGREVAQMVQGYRQAGTHEVTFDAANLSSGVYIYHLKSGNYSATEKMVLLK